MCGIAGILSNTPRSLGCVAQAMARALAHRGPDGRGYVALEPGTPLDAPSSEIPPEQPARVFLAHRRLSIIDLAGTRQPLRNEDGSVWTVFNGEIYNYQDLARNLADKGHTLREKGDTEVLVHLWEEFGPDMLAHLNGMFALAIYDTRRDVLFLARDRFGEKPLYYWPNANGFCFASELQALWEVPGFPLDDHDPVAMAQYFRYGNVPSPATIYKGVHALPPGCFLLRSPENLRMEEYWRPRVTGERTELDLEELQALFDESVRLRLVSDVPLGAFLSGGIDSSLVTASMSRQMDEPVNTFTISTGSHWCDESAEAQVIAEHLGTRHRVFPVTPNFSQVSERLARHYGQPFSDYSSVPTHYVSRETRNHVTVALTGDGGDELFAGYDKYGNLGPSRLASRIPRPLRPLLGGLAAKVFAGKRSGQYFFDFFTSAARLPRKGENHLAVFHDYWRRRCYTDSFQSALAEQRAGAVDRFSTLYGEATSSDPRERWLETDQRMLLANDMLTKVDIAAMSVSLETRTPFLDHRFAAYANSLAFGLKLNQGVKKHALRLLAARRIPREIIDLPKKGFTLPLAAWMRGELKDWAHATLFDDPTPWESYIRPTMTKYLWDSHQQGRIDHSMRLWKIMALCLWAKSQGKKGRDHE